MKIIAYIFFISLLLLVGVWLLLPYILRFFLRRFEKHMNEYMNEQGNQEQQQTIISKKSNSQAEQTDFEELN